MSGIFGILSQGSHYQDDLKKIERSLRHNQFQKIDTFQMENFSGIRVHCGVFNNEPQPLFNEDRTLCIFFDGRIYDYQHQIEVLQKKGHRFSSLTDPEYCLHAFEEYGTSFIKELNGSFIFLIFNLVTKKILIANDRFGFRVHYYYQEDNSFIISPEIKAILHIPSVTKELDSKSVAEFFAFGEFFGEKTLFSNINILPPATILTFENDKISKEKYWELRYKPDYSKTEDEFVKDLVRTFYHAVDIRMRDNLRYGITLSGGLDSRSVLAGMKPEKRRNIVAFTFGEDDCDEVTIAKRVTNIAAVKEHLIITTPPSSITQNAVTEVWLTEGRNTIGTSFSHKILYPVKEKVDVIFDGFALDLTLGGSFLNKKILQSNNNEELSQQLGRKRLFSNKELEDLLDSELFSKINHVPDNSYKIAFQKSISDEPGNTTDKFAMDNHVAWMNIGDVPLLNYFEVTHPTSDNAFIDVITRIPPKFRLNHAIYRKFLLELSPEFARIPYQKTMVSPNHPLLIWKLGKFCLSITEQYRRAILHLSKGKIILKNKRSYVNFNEWFFTSATWYEFFRKILIDESETGKKYLNQPFIERLWQEQIKRENDHSVKLLYLATFRIFLAHFFTEKPDKSSSSVKQ